MHLDELASVIGNVKNLDLMNQELDKKEEKEIDDIKAKYSKKRERLAAQVEEQRQQILAQVGENFNKRYKDKRYLLLLGPCSIKTYYDFGPASSVDFCEDLPLKVVCTHLSPYRMISRDLLIPYAGTFLVTLLGPHKFIVQSNGEIVRAVEKSDHSCLEIQYLDYCPPSILSDDIVVEIAGTEISLIKKPNITHLVEKGLL